jgi:hypothetical protein
MMETAPEGAAVTKEAAPVDASLSKKDTIPEGKQILQ